MTGWDRNARALAGTVLVHLLLVALLLLWEVPVTASRPAEVDLDWVLPAPATGSGGVGAAPGPMNRGGASVADRLPVEGRGTIATDRAAMMRDRMAVHPPERRAKNTTMARRAPERQVGRGGVAVAIGWKSGPERKKRSGSLPAYPAGTRAGGEIKVDVTVAPDGAVSKVVASGRGDKRLSQAAVKAVRTWRFEPLRGAAPRRSQGCTVTFRFRPREIPQVPSPGSRSNRRPTPPP